MISIEMIFYQISLCWAHAQITSISRTEAAIKFKVETIEKCKFCVLFSLEWNKLHEIKVNIVTTIEIIYLTRSDTNGL